MSHGLDQALVGIVLAASVAYALMSLGPRALRVRIMRLLGRAPADATAKAKGACGGCDNCGAGISSAAQSTPSARSTPPEIKIPVGKIGRRA